MAARRYSVQPARRQRLARRPAHSFYVAPAPYVIAPFLLAPVLPGDSLYRLTLQSRAVTDPIANPLLGWWLEHYIFYCRLSQLDEGLTSMVSDLTFDASAFHSTGVSSNYSSGTLDYAAMCLDTVVEHFFRLEDEVDAGHKALDGRPLAAINGGTVFESLISDSDRVYDEPEIPAEGGAGVKLTGSDIAQLLRDWEIAREERPELTYEAFLELHAGIRDRDKNKPRPELLRYSRAWQLPSNTVNPADGSVASAVSWVIAERADKPRYFSEPGFVFGATCARPKIYLGKQKHAAANLMDFAAAWVPSIGLADPMLETMRKYAEGTGILTQAGGDGDYWLDIRDLLIHGDQFLDNVSAMDRNILALPLGNVDNTQYPSASDIEGLFVGTSYTVRQDGIVQLDIRSAATQRSPAHSP